MVGMGRIARVVMPGVAHHVTQRGNRRMQAFSGEDDGRAPAGPFPSDGLALLTSPERRDGSHSRAPANRFWERGQPGVREQLPSLQPRPQATRTS